MDIKNIFESSDSLMKSTIYSDQIRRVGNSTFAMAKVDALALWYIIEYFSDGIVQLKARSPFFDNDCAALLEFNSLKERAYV